MKKEAVNTIIVAMNIVIVTFGAVTNRHCMMGQIYMVCMYQTPVTIPPGIHTLARYLEIMKILCRV